MNNVHKIELAIEIGRAFLERYGKETSDYLKKRVREEWTQLLERDAIDVVWEAWKLTQFVRKNELVAGAGSSFDGVLIFYLLKMTPFDPLPAHYCCDCGHFELRPEAPQGDELMLRRCPECGEWLVRSGFNLSETTQGEYEFLVAPQHMDKVLIWMTEIRGFYLKIAPDESLAAVSRLYELDRLYPERCRDDVLSLFGNGMFAEESKIGVLGVMNPDCVGLLDIVHIDSFWELCQVVGARLCGVEKQVEQLLREGCLCLDDFSFSHEDYNRKGCLGVRWEEFVQAGDVTRNVVRKKAEILREAAKLYYIAACKVQRIGIFYAWAFCELRFRDLTVPLPEVKEMEVEDALCWVKEHFLPRMYPGDIRTIEQLEQYMIQAQVPEVLRIHLMLCVEMTTCYLEWADMYSIYGRVQYELSELRMRYLQWFGMWQAVRGKKDAE